jgi:hypothetical protein
MNIDREVLERELAHVRAQKAQAESIFNQAAGAEAVLVNMIRKLDTPAEDAVPAANTGAAAKRGKR